NDRRVVWKRFASVNDYSLFLVWHVYEFRSDPQEYCETHHSQRVGEVVLSFPSRAEDAEAKGVVSAGRDCLQAIRLCCQGSTEELYDRQRGQVAHPELCYPGLVD